MVVSIHFYLSFTNYLLFVVAYFETWIHCLYSIGQYCNIILLQYIVLFGQWKHIYTKRKNNLNKICNIHRDLKNQLEMLLACTPLGSNV